MRACVGRPRCLPGRGSAALGLIPARRAPRRETADFHRDLDRRRRRGGARTSTAVSLVSREGKGDLRTATTEPSSAKEAVEAGLEAFKERGDAAAALRLFNVAMGMRPNKDEARAARYNAACALTKLGRLKEAAEAVVEAVNEYDLKLSVAVKDDDLERLRGTREWRDAMENVKGGMTQSMRIGLRTEQKAPFRLARFWILGGLAAGAGLGLAIIITRLIAALRGGEGAPDLSESLQNLAINTVALAALVFLLRRDFLQREKDLSVVGREEELAELQVEWRPNNVQTLQQLRGVVRPLVIAGTRGYVRRSLKAAERYSDDLVSRGMSIIPLVLKEGPDPSSKISALKAKLQSDVGSTGPAVGFGEEAATDSEKRDKKWELRPYNISKWQEWVDTQKKYAKIDGENFYVQIQLDGTVRASGEGTPPWDSFMNDVPTLDSIRTKLGDNIGPTA